MRVTGDDCSIRGNRVRNIHFGIRVSGARAFVERNAVDRFAGDGARAGTGGAAGSRGTGLTPPPEAAGSSSGDCGCRVAGEPARIGHGAWLLLLAIGAARRRARARQPTTDRARRERPTHR